MQRKMLATTSKVFRVARGEDDNNDDEDEDEDEDNDEDEDKDDEEDAKGVGKKRGLNEEDVLGPPWVEPNRHCTLMFYLNDVPSGGGETTFPLAKGAPPLVAALNQITDSINETSRRDAERLEALHRRRSQAEARVRAQRCRSAEALTANWPSTRRSPSTVSAPSPGIGA